MTLVQQRMASLGLMLLLGAAAVGAVVWQQRTSSRDAEQKTAAQRLLTIESPDEVTKATLVTPTGTFELEHTGTDQAGWQLTAPIKTLAEAATVDAMLRAAMELQMTSRVGGKGPDDDMRRGVAPPSDLAMFGLAPARTTLTLTTKSGVTQSLLLGKKNSYDGSIYAKRADAADVGLVNGSFVYQLDLDLYKLREKRPFIAQSGDITEVTVRPAKGEGLTLQHKGQDYQLTAPMQALADTTQAEGLVNALTGLRAKLVAMEEASTPTQRGHFGLNPPAYTVRVGLQAGGAVELLFGELQLGEETHYFVQRADIPSPVMELGSDWVFKKLGLKAAELRDMHVVRFDRDAVRGVHIKRTGEEAGELNFTKQHDKQENIDHWLLNGNTMQSSKVMALVVRIGNLRADSVATEKPSDAQLAASGLLAPRLQVDLTGDEGAVLASLRVGQSEGEHEHVCDQNKARIVRVQKTALEDISLNAVDYQEAATAKSN